MVQLNVLWVILACISSYFIGSIPFSVWLGKLFYKKDLREFHTKNPGGINAIVTYGATLGLPVLFLDFFKGTLTILLLDKIFSNAHFEPASGINLWHIFACVFGSLFCVLGHQYSPFLKFGGGQGIGIFVGVLFYVNPLILVIFILMMIPLMNMIKLDVSHANIVDVILVVLMSIFLPIGPPWNSILNAWVKGSTGFVHMLLFLICTALAIGLLQKFLVKQIRGRRKWSFTFKKGPQDKIESEQ
ncbi:MAG: glycerol-3-phosphate acyltransferase [Asgard group archaeon]|nr:glycerol-3-phosphate acyltransferase [Asgard group archaeon]